MNVMTECRKINRTFLLLLVPFSVNVYAMDQDADWTTVDKVINITTEAVPSEGNISTETQNEIVSPVESIDNQKPAENLYSSYKTQPLELYNLFDDGKSILPEGIEIVVKGLQFLWDGGDYVVTSSRSVVHSGITYFSALIAPRTQTPAQ